MTDTLERRLRETLDRRAGAVRVPPVTPEHVLRRTRRRQGRTVALAGLIVALLGLVSFAGVRALTGGPSGTIPGEGDFETRTVHGVTVSFPPSWYFEELVPQGPGITSAGEIPLFALANRTPEVSLFSGVAESVCTPTTVVLAVIEQHGVLGTVPSWSWPVSLHRIPGKEADGCGEDWEALWTADGRYFQGVVRVGSDAPPTDREQAFAAFQGLSFGPDPSPFPIPSPAPVATAEPAPSPSCERTENSATCSATVTLAPSPAGETPQPVPPEHGGTYWGLYLVVGDIDEAKRVYQDATRAGWPAKWSVDLSCDRGAQEALGVGNQPYAAMYFESRNDAEIFAEAHAEGLGVTPVGIARVTTYCLD